MQAPETKECGLEDEKAGDIQSERPLVNDGYCALTATLNGIPIEATLSPDAEDRVFTIITCRHCNHWKGPPAQNPEGNTNCFRCGSLL